MRPRSLVIVLVLTLAVLVVAFHLRGRGHRLLMQWAPSIHGR
jgi:hypothetical protein